MMKKTKNKLYSGTSLAFAMATLAGCQMFDKQDSPTSKVNTSSELVHCYGVNSCKGHNDCGSANNGCHGQGSCKGKGFVALPKESCKHIGGQINDDWVGQISNSDLIHCYGVNICGGHNDCSSANNACNGKASCKGKGFVKATSEACKHIGGKIGD